MTAALTRVIIPFEVRSVDEVVQPAYKIAKKIEMPTEAETQAMLYIPQWKDEPLKGYNDWHNNDYVAQVSDIQVNILAQEISRETGKNWRTLHIQTSYDLAHTSKPHRKFLENYWIHNDGILIEDGFIIPRPTAEVKNSELVFTGEKVPVEINKKSVIDTLVNAGEFKRGEHRILDNGIDFEKGLSSVRSDWDRDEDCFGAGSDGPSDGDDGGLAAFTLVEPKSEVKQPKKREVTEAEYQEFLEFKRIKPELQHLLSKFK